jgi:hypothetical protein
MKLLIRPQSLSARPTTVLLLAACLAATATMLNAAPVRAATGCRSIVPSRNGWAVNLCPSDPAVAATMAVKVDGAAKGTAAFLQIYHNTASGKTQPQIAVIYASGYLRLKENADPPGAPIPFGASAILGPALWRTATDYWHNPTLTTLELSTASLPNYLSVTAAGANRDLNVSYHLALTATDARTTMDVSQQATARVAIPIDASRAAEGQGAKTAAQISSLHIPTGAPCDGGRQLCQDIDQVRFLTTGITLRTVNLDDVVHPGFLLPAAAPLTGLWLDARHSTDLGWQGNTPSIRICLDPATAGHDTRVQGYVARTSNPNNDNAGIWVDDQTRAVTGWRSGETEVVTYRVVAQDDFTTVSSTAC